MRDVAHGLTPRGAEILLTRGPRNILTGDPADLEDLRVQRYANRLGAAWYSTPAGLEAIEAYQADHEAP